MKMGLDFHGVIDKYPGFFSELTKHWVTSSNEVHIITGSQKTKELEEELINRYRIYYTHFFSITDYHLSIGTPIRFDEKSAPWMNEEIWNRTKAEYCLREGIDMHIDDSERYLRYFKTPYMLLPK